MISTYLLPGLIGAYILVLVISTLEWGLFVAGVRKNKEEWKNLGKPTFLSMRSAPNFFRLAHYYFSGRHKRLKDRSLERSLKIYVGLNIAGLVMALTVLVVIILKLR